MEAERPEAPGPVQPRAARCSNQGGVASELQEATDTAVYLLQAALGLARAKEGGLLADCLVLGFKKLLQG